jgi:hypothetical protein
MAALPLASDDPWMPSHTKAAFRKLASMGSPLPDRHKEWNENVAETIAHGIGDFVADELKKEIVWQLGERDLMEPGRFRGKKLFRLKIDAPFEAVYRRLFSAVLAAMSSLTLLRFGVSSMPSPSFRLVSLSAGWGGWAPIHSAG